MRCLLLAVTAAAFRVYDDVSLPKGIYVYLDENNHTRKELMKGLGCYCKNVASMEECPNFKTSKTEWDPEYARWFHPNVSLGSETPHLCCKLAKTSIFSIKGRSYTKLQTAERCFSEVRPLSKDACCRIGEEEQLAVRVKQIRAAAGQEIRYYPTYHKSFPYFSVNVNDIAGATDYDGTELSLQQVKELLHYKVQAAGANISHREDAGETFYTCSKRMDELIADQEDCRIRPDPTECCCLQATVVPAQRCLPAAGAATVEAMRFNGSYTEKEVTKGDDNETFLQGNISWSKTFLGYLKFVENLDKDLPDLLQSQDPEAADGLEYDWSRATHQWKTRDICKAKQRFAWVRKKKHLKELFVPELGEDGHAKRFNTHYTFYQAWKEECISFQLNRICPKGQGLYVKQIPLGTCTKVPGPSNSDQLQMVGLGSGLMFQCPDGYQSGTKGAMKLDAHCKCDGC